MLHDINAFVNAFRADATHHVRDRAWLSAALNNDESAGVSGLTLSGFVRIVTNHRIFRRPTQIEAALKFCSAVMAAPAATSIRPSDRHWLVFNSLCGNARAVGNLGQDAYLAGLALENGAILVTSDTGVRRFAGLRSRSPG